MIDLKELKEIGKFQKTHALKGELNLISDLDIDFYEMGFPVIVDMDTLFVPFYVESVRPKGETTLLIRIEDIITEEEARKFVNKIVYARRSDLDKYAEETGIDFIDNEDLHGYKVIDARTGQEVGEVEDVDDSTENILLIVSTGDDSIYLPANDELIEEINDDEKRIIMIIPEGIADINRIHQDNDEV